MAENKMKRVQENLFWQIARGNSNSDEGAAEAQSKLKKQANAEKTQNAYDEGLSKAESLKNYDVEDVYGGVKKWIRSPHDPLTDLVGLMITKAYLSVSRVQKLLGQVQQDLEAYEGDIFQCEHRPPKYKIKMQAICVRHLKMMGVVLVALNEFESIFPKRPIDKQSAQQQADEIYRKFILQRDAIYI